MSSETLTELAKECNEISRSKGWLEEKRTFGDLISLMHSELSEALEEFRDNRGFDEIYWKCKNCGNEIDDGGFVHNTTVCKHSDWIKCAYEPEGIPIEYADTIIRILQDCGDKKIDIEYAFDLKMAFNRTRPHKHGGKAI